MKRLVTLRDLAHARSGDKGSDVNIGVIARSASEFEYLREHLTADVVKKFFSVACTKDVERYELPNLNAFNFMLRGALGSGGSSSLRSDAQGKAFGEALLHLVFD